MLKFYSKFFDFLYKTIVLKTSLFLLYHSVAAFFLSAKIITNFQKTCLKEDQKFQTRTDCFDFGKTEEYG